MNITHVNLARGFRGGERQTQLLIEALARRGVEQRLIHRRGSPLAVRLAGTEGLTFRPVGHFLQGHSLRPSRRHQLIHAHEAKGVYWAYLEHRLHGTPYVITRRVPQRLGSGRFSRSAYTRAAAVAALSGAIAAVLRDCVPGLDPMIIPSAYTGLDSDTDRIQAIRDSYAGKFLVGHIGALVDRHKGQSFLIDAARRIQSRFPDIHFILLGEGADGERLRAQAADLDNVEFLGFRDNVGDYLAAMDLFAFPSLNEGLGSILLDAMQFRLPIVASAVDGIPDIVEPERSGLLVPPQDSAAIAEAIVRLYRDRDLAARLAGEGARRLEEFSPERMAGRYLQLYESIMNTKDGDR